ncbi:Uncharacterized conserved protein, DUF305 family [Nonomuraea maritima]|uniref:Uncharacterized conserved protein, DUF305 family n=1 Tax=Nonomuraea maritima TaxID=683260 RepID=A0A1G9E9Z9_9ACTN|nr:DUF305 domain-containing protein [Nonomuraea maritima]SDK72982.1 Uncharacterized conserved protein, DUF305 family [Nonomuraea maritima]
MRGGHVLAVVALVWSAACGQAGGAEVPVNADDVMFVQMMVQHHRQGIEMAGIGASRAEDPEVRTLASAIVSTEQDEVEMMLRWLHAWDQPLTAPTGAHDHHGGMPETDVKRIQELRASDDLDYDLLSLLIDHQDGAVRMAADVVTRGANPEVQRWAAQVQTSRRAQIAMMTDLVRR